MRAFLLIVIGIHGLIHLAGFFKAFRIFELSELSIPISRPLGWLWLLASILIFATIASHSLKVPYWWLIGLAAVLLSQFLIICFWKDARYGTILNIIMLGMVIVGYATWNFKETYRNDVMRNLSSMDKTETEILTEKDMQHLPLLVQKYLYYTGVLNRPKVKNFKVTFEATMRSESQDWFPLTVEQYDFFDPYERLFFLDARVKGLPTQGYHKYGDNHASMQIKVLSLIPVVTYSGEEMYRAETVTLFNDMCFLAPATLIDKNITWENIDDRSVRATFVNRGISISAILYFNSEGQLANFVSNDRYDVNRKQPFRFSTPLSDYREINGYNLAHYGEAIWHYPEGEFTYGRYQLKSVQYNIAN